MRPTVLKDEEKARDVVLRVHNAYKKKQGILSDTADLVENQIPVGVRSLSREHALFLFYIVANDHGTKSSRLYMNGKRLYAERPDLFEPSCVVGNHAGPDDEFLLEYTGKYLSARYPKEAAKSWYLNSEKLIEEYDGDPINLFSSTKDAVVLLKKIKTFRGYGPKIGGMLLRALVGLGFAKVHNLEKVLLPVDIHDTRISFMTGMLQHSEDYEEKIDYYTYVPQVQKLLLDTCNGLNIDWLDTDRALWLIGSKGCVNKRCSECPLSEVCANRPSEKE